MKDILVSEEVRVHELFQTPVHHRHRHIELSTGVAPSRESVQTYLLCGSETMTGYKLKTSKIPLSETQTLTFPTRDH